MNYRAFTALTVGSLMAVSACGTSNGVADNASDATNGQLPSPEDASNLEEQVPAEALRPAATECYADFAGLFDEIPAFRGTITSNKTISEPFRDEFSKSLAAGRQITFDNVKPYGTAALQSEVMLTWTQAINFDGAWDPVTSMEADALDSLTGQEVFVMYDLSAAEPNGSDGYVAHIIGAGADGELKFPSTCGDVWAGHADEIISAAAISSPVELVDQWLAAEAAGSESTLVALETAVLNTDGTPPIEWADLDPTQRSLLPTEVPEEVQTILDVRPVYLEMSDVEAGDLVYLRTESGSSLQVTAESLPTVTTAYFLPTDTVIEVGIRRPDGSTEPIAKWPIIEAVASGALLISGTPGDPTVESLSVDEVAKRFGISVDELEELRKSYLEPLGG